MEKYSKELFKIANMLQKIGENPDDNQDSQDNQNDSQDQNQDSQNDNQDQQDQDQSDQQDQGDQQDQNQGDQGDQQGQGNQQDFDSQLTTVISDLSKQMNNLKYDIENMKSVVMTKSQVDNADYNTNVLANNQILKKQAFLKIMDELNDVADAFVHTNPHISRKIDNVMDSLRFYDKSNF